MATTVVQTINHYGVIDCEDRTIGPEIRRSEKMNQWNQRHYPAFVVACLAGLSVILGLPLAEGQETVKSTGWSSSLAVGANTASGNSETMGLTGSLISEMNTDQYETRLGLEGNYGRAKIRRETDGVVTHSDDTTADNLKVYANGKRRFGADYLFSDSSIFHDRQADLQSRLVLGSGVGRYLLESAQTKLAADIGIAYLREDLSTESEVNNSLAYRVSARFEQKLSDTSKLWASVEYLPKAEDVSDCLCNGEAGLESALNGKLSLRMVTQDRFVSRPPADHKENDLLVTGSVVYKF
jgi:putative salt-induced outer membrane protein YdiY